MIKFIFITFLVIFFMRMVAPVLFRWLLGAFVKKQMRKGGFFSAQQHRPYQQQPENNGQHNDRATDKVKIDYIPEQPGHKDFSGGEYVDYEEVK